MSDWGNFYVLTGSAAATLIGLMFIAITFGAKLITKETLGLVRWILSPMIYHFAHAFIIACVALMPTAQGSPLGYTVVVLTLFRAAMLPSVAKNLKRASQERGSIELSDWIYGIAAPLLIFVLLFISGIALINTSSWAMHGIAAGVIGLLVLGTLSAWDMLLWMALQVGQG